MNFRDGAEFRRIAASFPWRSDGRGVGDDAALVGERGLFCCDALAEGVHFRWDWSTPQDVGWKAVAANVADIACTGGRPLHAVWSIGMGSDWTDAIFSGLAEGALEAARAAGVALVGGDTVRCQGPGFVSLSLWGELPDGQAWLRSGARPGDQLVVVGSMGWSAAGLSLLQAGRETQPELAPLVASHRRPALAPLLADRAPIHAGIDLSDGLSSECAHLAAGSGVLVRLESAHLAPDPLLSRAARTLGADPMEWMLHGGEDHSLLLAMDPQAPLPPGGKRIGRIEPGSGTWLDQSPLVTRAWDHG